MGWPCPFARSLASRATSRPAVSVGSDGEAEKLVSDLGARGYQRLTLVEQEATERLATARLVPPGEGAAGVVVDLLFASSGIEPELVAAAETLDVMDGVVVPVAGVGHLLALKLLARDDAARPQDSVDIRALLDCASPKDRSVAAAAVKLIAERGYSRDRELIADLAALLAAAGQ